MRYATFTPRTRGHIGFTLSFFTANIIIPPARAVGVFLTIDRVCSPCRRADGLSMMGWFSKRKDDSESTCSGLRKGYSEYVASWATANSNFATCQNCDAWVKGLYYRVTCNKTHLKKAGEWLAQLVREVVLGVDRQVVLENIDRVLAALVRCGSLRGLARGRKTSNSAIKYYSNMHLTWRT